MESEDRISIEALLGYQDWIQGLAQSLVGKGESAADVVQDTWMTALERPPRDAGNLKSWLASVARHALSQQRRGKARRQVRENQANVAPDLPSPEEVLERESLRRLVVSELMALDPDVRDVLLLKFYAGLPPRKIAESLEIPVETARTRARRGLESLRRQLDRHYGDRKSWSVGVLAMAGISAPGTSVLAGSMTSKISSVLLGVFAVSPAVKLVLAMASLLLLFVAAWWWMGPDGGEDLDAGRSSATLAKSKSVPGARREASSQNFDVPAREPVEPRSSVGAGAKIQRVEGEAARIVIEGRISDENGRAIPGATVCVASANEITEIDLRSLYGSETMKRVRAGGHEYTRAKTDEDGNYRLDADAFDGPASVVAWSKTQGVALAARRQIQRAPAINRIDLRIETGLVVYGRVEDEAGEALSGAFITFMYQTSATAMSSGGPRVNVDANGNYRTQALCFPHVQLSAHASGFQTGYDKGAGEKGGPRAVRLDFVLRSLPTLEGHLVLEDGRSVNWQDLVASQFPSHSAAKYLKLNRVRIYGSNESAENEVQFLGLHRRSGDVDSSKSSYRIQRTPGMGYLVLAVGNRIVAEAALPENGEAPDLVVDPSKMPVPVDRRSLLVTLVGGASKTPIVDYVWYIRPADRVDLRIESRQGESSQSESRIKDLAVGPWQLQVSSAGWTKAYLTVDLVSGQEPQVVEVVMLPANASIKGRIVDASQQGVAQAQFSLYDANGNPVVGPNGFAFLADSDGNFECSKLAAQRYTLAVVAKGHPLQAQEVLAKADGKGAPVVIQLPPGIEVALKFEGNSGPISPRVFDAAGRKLRDDVSTYSRFHGPGMSLTLVENETYRIEFVSPGFSTAVVKVRARPGLVIPVVFEAKSSK